MKRVTLTTYFEHTLRERGKVIALVRVTHIPAWLLKSRTNPCGSWLYISRLWVAKTHRRQGVASRMFRRALDLCVALDRSIVIRAVPYADEPCKGKALRAFYERYGFRSISPKETMIYRVRPGEW